jgi:hypothetical protein
MATRQISIVLPVHNGAKYLSEALQSIFAQTYPHFDVLVLENASSDATPQLLAAIDDPRLHVYPSDQFLSIEANWARITTLPLAPYLTLMGHDDRWHPQFLETLMDLIEIHPKASMYTTQFNLIGEQGRYLRPCKPIPSCEDATTFLNAVHQFQRDFYGTGFILRTTDFIQLGGMPTLPGLMFADVLLAFWVMQRGDKVASQAYLFDYRYHRHSAARQSSLALMFQASQAYLAALKASPYWESPGQQALAQNHIHHWLVRQHRAILASLLANPQQSQDYDRMMAHLRQDQHWVGDEDRWVRWLIACRALPPSLQRGLAWGLRALAALTWHLRNR